MTHDHPLVIIGTGPAGMTAAQTALAHGVRPVVIDEQPAPGGQIYRGVTSTPLRDRELLGRDYWRGKELADELRKDGIDYRPGHVVWQLSPEREIGILAEDQTHTLHADQIILATGAQERPFPIPGWTLPGVMAAGAAQVLMKTSGVVPEPPLVLAGCGPLLYLVAAQYHRVGVQITALLETTPGVNYRQAIRHAGAALRGARYLGKGLGLLREIRQGGIRHERRVTALRAEGNGKLERVSWQSAKQPDRWQSIDATTLLLHHGIVPNIQISRALGMEHDWDHRQLCWRPRRDAWGEGSIPGIRIAGDGAGITGATAAELDGRITALGALAALGRMDASTRDKLARPLQRKYRNDIAVRPFLETLYRPADIWRMPADEVIVCRCEEVTAGEVRKLAGGGCMGPNQMKSFTRCGMGPCQGRMCSLTVTELMAEAHAVSPSAIGSYRLRPPFKPISLEQLANSTATDNAPGEAGAPASESP